MAVVDVENSPGGDVEGVYVGGWKAEEDDGVKCDADKASASKPGGGRIGEGKRAPNT